MLTSVILVETIVAVYAIASLVGSLDEDYFGWAAWFELPLFIAGSVAWLMWQYQSHKRLANSSAVSLRFTPAWGVGWWFVPFVQLVQPFRAMKELWTAPIAGGTEPDTRLSPMPILAAWWTCFLGGNLASRLGAALIASGNDNGGLLWIAIAAALLVAAGVLAILVVRGIESRLWESLSGGQESSATTALLAAGGALAGAVVGAALWVLGPEISDELFDVSTGSFGDALYGAVAAALVGVILGYVASAVSGRAGAATALPAMAGSVLALLVGNAVLGDLSTRVGVLIDDANVPLLTAKVVFVLVAAALSGVVAMRGTPVEPWVLSSLPEAGDGVT